MQWPESIRAELSPGEQVVWHGQPRQGIVVRGSDALMIPFSLLWTGFAVFWVLKAAQLGAPLPFVLFGVSFVLVGAYVVIGRFLVEAKQREKTFYALTPSRIIIASGVFSRTVKSLPLKTLSEISLSERSNGIGTITFGGAHPMASMFSGMASWPGVESFLGPRFDLVSEARTVYEKVRQAQAAAK